MSIILDGTSGINTPNTFAYKNLLIDAGFTINQRAYVSAATLASGSYGHDRWKAGASGGDYSFTQLASNTQITIASGKSLIQVVEDKNVNGTSYVLSWTGTAQARYAVNSATPAGSYAASPIVITGQTAGTTMSVEFNTGTLSKPQLELGAVATSFDQRDYGTELALCQRYAIDVAGKSLYSPCGTGFSISTTEAFIFIPLQFSMRSTPSLDSATSAASILQLEKSGSLINLTTLALVGSATASSTGLYLDCGAASGLTANDFRVLRNNNSATAKIILSAEL
jgi:hypothetical protein